MLDMRAGQAPQESRRRQQAAPAVCGPGVFGVRVAPRRGRRWREGPMMVRVRCLQSWSGLALVTSLIGLLGACSTASAADPPLETRLANSPVVVSAEQFRQDLFVAGDVARLSAPENTVELVL